MKDNKAIKIIGTVAFAVAFLAVTGIYRSYVSSTTVTPEAHKTTYVNGCVSTGGEDLRAYCGCAYDKLLAMHPKLDTDPAITQRIIKEGYNQTETNAMMQCYNNLVDTQEI